MRLATIGDNSRGHELAEVRKEIRDRMNVAGMTPEWQARWEIMLSDMNAHDKLVAIAISFFADKQTGRAHPSVTWMQAMASTGRSRVLQATSEAVKRGHLLKVESGQGRGRATVYTLAVPEKTLTELAAKLQESKENVRHDGCFKMSKMSATADIKDKRSTDSAKRSTKPPENVHGGGPQHIELNKPIKNTRERDAETRDASGRRWASRDPFGLNPWQREHHRDVQFDDDFRLEVHNGFETEMLEKLKPVGIDLRDALDEAAKYVQRSAPPAELKIQVRSQITRIAREAKERADSRIARLRASQAPPQNQQFAGEMQQLRSKFSKG